MAELPERETMMLLAIYTAQCEAKVRDQGQRLVQAEQARWARQLGPLTGPGPLKPRSRPEQPALQRLVSALGLTG